MARTTELEVTDLELCEDCVFYLNNGSCPEPCSDGKFSCQATNKCQLRAAIDQQWPIDEYGIWWQFIFNYADDGSFSRLSCDGCGSNLGGTRYPATAFLPAPDRYANGEIKRKE